jgi:hypothetical protein
MPGFESMKGFVEKAPTALPDRGEAHERQRDEKPCCLLVLPPRSPIESAHLFNAYTRHLSAGGGIPRDDTDPGGGIERLPFNRKGRGLG